MALWTELYDTFYPAGTRARAILEQHSRSVADLALDINARRALGIDPAQVEAAAMLHDIGIFLTDAPSIDCHGCRPYLLHGVLGADLLRRHDLPEWAARVAERHTGTGIAPDEVALVGLPDDGRTYMPQSELERLVCYADKFYSKSRDMSRKSIDRVRRSLARFGDASLARFEALHAAFGIE